MQIHTDLSHLTNHTKYLAFKDLVRSYLIQSQYTEVQVPTLSPTIIPEGYLGIFRTELDFFGDKDYLHLTPHPEIFLKRLLVAGSPSIFAISSSYRNHEATTHKHSPEFDMLEFYKVNADYNQLAEDVLGLLQYVCQQWFGSMTFGYNNKIIDVSSWEVITVAQAFAKYAGITEIFDQQQFLKQATDLGYKTEGFEFTEVFSQIYSDKVEDHLGANGHPTLIKDYPQSLGATARWNNDKQVAERWEFYIEGIELGNAANEQADHLTLEELKSKYATEMLDRIKNNLTPIEPDLEFAQLLKDLPSCSGIGMGLERLCAIFLDLTDIRDLKVSWVE
jgi:elongation factor P--(R)-beta-lysine ligase